MGPQLPESDWRRLRDLKETALDRYCERVLAELSQLAADSGRGHYQRYRDIWKLIEKRDDELSGAFDDLKRSNALWRLTAMCQLGLLDEEELQGFSAETRERLNFLLGKT